MRNLSKIYNKLEIETLSIKFGNSMNKVVLVCCVLFWFGCKKETENITQAKINKDDYLVEKIVWNDKSMREFFYDSLNRIKTIKYSSLVDSTNKSTSIYTYDSNTVFINDNQPRLYYLNNKILVDSSYMKVPNNWKDNPDAVKSTRVYYVYDAEDMLIAQKSNYIYESIFEKSMIAGSIFNYNYQSKNLILTNQTDKNYNWITSYTYYLDKKNDLLEFDKLTTFVKSSYNLIKTENSGGSIFTYSYEFNELGLVNQITKDYGNRIEVRKIYWRKK
jgi:hypothetical protein